MILLKHLTAFDLKHLDHYCGCLTSESTTRNVSKQDCSRFLYDCYILLSLVIFLKHLTAFDLKLHGHYQGCTCGCLKQMLGDSISGFGKVWNNLTEVAIMCEFLVVVDHV